jgi:TPR repeat protein
MRITLPIVLAALGVTSLGSAQSPSPATSGAASDDKAIRPFHFTASKEALADMRKRVAATRWPEKETVTDRTQGVQLATIQKLAKYWATDYDWGKCEAKLKALPQFVTNIDGVDEKGATVHPYYREPSRSPQGNALAQNNLGLLYDLGDGVPQDYAVARQWYEQSAAQNHAAAQFNLGLLYANGHGVPQDYAMARQWYEKAMAAGDPRNSSSTRTPFGLRARGLSDISTSSGTMTVRLQ